MNSNETLLISMLAASTTTEYSDVSIPRKSSSGTAVESGSGAVEPAGDDTAADGGDKSAPSPPGAEGLSGSVRLGCIGSLGEVLLFVHVVAYIVVML